MNAKWPPLDVHTHVAPSIHPTELLSLRAVLFVATRSLSEFESTATRADPITVWGLGVHPGLPAAIEGFSRDAFRAALPRTPLVSEIGLDARSPVPLKEQQQVFDQILGILDNEPRIISVHSAGATTACLDVVEQHAARGLTLHWWRGRPGETARAIKLGCWFSINPAELRHPRVLGRVPLSRLFTETDHPYGNRGAYARPGLVPAIETAIGVQAGTIPATVREGMWGNLAHLVDVTGTLELFPDRIRQLLQAASGLFTNASE